jgi:hypothetical protein
MYVCRPACKRVAIDLLLAAALLVQAAPTLPPFLRFVKALCYSFPLAASGDNMAVVEQLVGGGVAQQLVAAMDRVMAELDKLDQLHAQVHSADHRHARHNNHATPQSPL